MNTYDRCRSASPIDAAILTLALVMGTGSVPIQDWISPSRFWSESYNPTLHLLGNLMCLSPPILAALTLGFLLIRLRRPRPAIRRLARQPGFAGCMAVLTICLGNLLTNMADALIQRTPHRFPFDWLSHTVVPLGMAGVLGAWFALRLTGLHRKEPGWIDRLGRSVGWLWVLAWLTFVVLSALSQWVD